MCTYLVVVVVVAAVIVVAVMAKIWEMGVGTGSTPTLLAASCHNMHKKYQLLMSKKVLETCRRYKLK
jgi:hypothetical protein